MTTFRFGGFRFDDHSNRLFLGRDEARIQPKSAQLLAYFLQHQGEILSKERLLNALWAETSVSDDVLFQSLRKLRATLARDGQDTYIKTYPGQGYQWVFPMARRAGSLKRRRGVFALMLVVLIAVLVLWRNAERPPAARPAIAISDFRDLSGDPEDAWYGVAIAEVLRADLTQSRSLRLVSGESTARARVELALPSDDSYAPETLQSIRGYLGNDYWVGGSYIVDDELVRINLILQETAAGTTVFSVTKTGPKGAFVDLVGEFAQSVAGSFDDTEVVAKPETRMRRALLSDPEVARAYMTGLRMLRAQSFQAAAAQFEVALEGNPDSALTLMRLAQCWRELGHDQKASEFSERAMERHASLPIAHRLMIEAEYAETQSGWAKSADLYQTLCTLFPDEPDYGFALVEARIREGEPERAEDALSQMRRSAQPHIQPRLALLESRVAQLRADSNAMVDASQRAIDAAHERRLVGVEAEALLINCEGQRRLGALKEAFDAAQRAADLFQRTGDENGVSDALLQQGNTYMQTGDLGLAEAAYNRALDLKGEIGQLNGLGSALNNLGAIAYRRGDTESAESLFKRAQEAFEATGDGKRAANAWINLGIIGASRSDFDAAFESYRQADVLYQSIGNVDGRYRVTHSLATLYHAKGDPETALAQLGRAIELVKTHHLNAELPRARMNYAMVQRQLGDLAGARTNLLAAAEAASDQAQSAMFAQIQFRLGELNIMMGELSPAESAFGAAFDAYMVVDEPANAMLCRVGQHRVAWQRGTLDDSDWHDLVDQSDPRSVQHIGVLRLQTAIDLQSGRFGDAISNAREATQLTLAYRDKHQELLSHRLLVEALLGDGRMSEAQDAFRLASESLTRANFPFVSLRYKITQARLLYLQGRSDAALELLAQAVDGFEANGALTYVLEAQIARAEIAQAMGDDGLYQEVWGQVTQLAHSIGSRAD